MSTSPDAPSPVRRATIANLGCKVNQSEMDVVERLLRARGVELIGDLEPADLVVVNTCTVTAVADRKSRQAVRRARRGNPNARVMVTGCSVVIDPDALAAADPAAQLFGNDSKGRLLAELAPLLESPDGRRLSTLSGVERAAGRNERSVGAGFRDRADFEAEADEGPVEDGFERDIDRTRAFVKIQDGCSFYCTYCIIPKARGPARSVPTPDVLADVRGALDGGHREIVLTGINAGTYTDGDRGLPDLARSILAETSIERIRLSSIEPQHVTDELLDVWSGSAGRCLPHFHVPLQSGDDKILRRMGRRYDSASYAGVVGRIRAAMPEAAIHADVIAGFPGEDDAAWARTLGLVRSLDLAGIHVFRYSARPGTPAARMVGQVDARTARRRAAEALALAAQVRASSTRRQIGRELRVLFERRLPDGRWLGHAENYVATVTAAPDERPLDNAIGLVRAESVDTAAPDRVAGTLQAVDRGPSRIAAGSISHEPLAEAARK